MDITYKTKAQKHRAKVHTKNLQTTLHVKKTKKITVHLSQLTSHCFCKVKD